MTKLKDTGLNKGVLKRFSDLGIDSLKDLSKIGAIKAYLMLKDQHEEKVLPKCYNLYDPAAIIMGKKNWKTLSNKEKKELDLVLKSEQSEIYSLISQGDRRTTKGVSEVIDRVNNNPKLIEILILLWSHQRPEIQMRASDALEKVTRNNSLSLKKFHSDIMIIPELTSEQEALWHWCQIIPRLDLTGKECDKVLKKLKKLLDHKSKIVEASALEAMVLLVKNDSNSKKSQIKKIIDQACKSGAPSIKARAKKLVKILDS